MPEIACCHSHSDINSHAKFLFKWGLPCVSERIPLFYLAQVDDVIAWRRSVAVAMQVASPCRRHFVNKAERSVTKDSLFLREKDISAEFHRLSHLEVNGKSAIT